MGHEPFLLWLRSVRIAIADIILSVHTLFVFQDVRTVMERLDSHTGEQGTTN